MLVVARVDELGGDPYPIAGTPNRPLENRGDAELLANLPQASLGSLVTHRRRPADHFEPLDLSERGQDLLHDAVREILVGRIRAQVGERQDRDRTGWRDRDGGDVRVRREADCENPRQLGNALELAFAEGIEPNVPKVTQLTRYVLADDDLTGLGGGVNPRGE